MLTLNDLRYLLRLVQCDAFDGVSMKRSLRVEGKLAGLIGGMRSDPLLRVALAAYGETHTVADQGGRCVGLWTLTMYDAPKGGMQKMGKTVKAAPKKKAAAKPTSKTTKRK